MSFIREYIGSDPLGNLKDAPFQSFVSVDVDGVLGDLSGSLTPYMLEFLPDFTPERYVREWGFESLRNESPEAYARVVELFNDASFLGALPPDEGVRHALWDLHTVLGALCAHADEAPWVVIHTHVPPMVFPADVKGTISPLEERARVRLNWCVDLVSGLVKGNPRFAFLVDTGESKANLSCFTPKCLALFEDNLSAVGKSLASSKYLIRRSHTATIPLGWDPDFECMVCESFPKAVCDFCEGLLL